MASPANAVNVTVVIPNTLRGAVEGRKQVSLGLPSSADVGDLLQTLLKLYPKLGLHVATDRKTDRPSLCAFQGEQASLELAHRRGGLKEGARIYLSAAAPRRVPGVVG